MPRRPFDECLSGGGRLQDPILGQRCDNPTGKGRDESAVDRPLYIRAGRSICSDRMHTAPTVSLFHTSWHPRSAVFVGVFVCFDCPPR